MHGEFVYNDLDVVVLVAVRFHSALNLFYLSVDAHIYISLLPEAFEEFAVVAFALAYEWCQHENAVSCIVGHNHVEHLLFGVFHHLLASGVAVSGGSTGEEQSKVVVDLCRGADRGARILVRGLLFDAYHGTEARYLVNVWAFHAAEKVAGIGRKRLYIATLTFGKNGVESQRRFA